MLPEFICKSRNYISNRNLYWWIIFGPVTCGACLNFAIPCRHRSHWLVVYSGFDEGVLDSIIGIVRRLTITFLSKESLINSAWLLNGNPEVDFAAVIYWCIAWTIVLRPNLNQTGIRQTGLSKVILTEMSSMYSRMVQFSYFETW